MKAIIEDYKREGFTINEIVKYGVIIPALGMGILVITSILIGA